MRINLNGPASNEIAADQQATQVDGKQRAHSHPATAGEDKATLSKDTVAISSLAQMALQTPDIRQEKVEALRQSVNSGQYKIDPSGIADAILKDSGK